MAEIIDNNSQLSEKSDNNGTSESSPINNRHILNESLKIVLVLGVLALIAAILLSVVNYYTKIDASVIIRETIGQSYSSSIEKEINIDNLSQYSETEIIKAYEAEDGAIIIVSKALKGEKVCYNADGITIIVVIKDNKLIKIVPFAHSETPGLGEKALKEDHLRQYEGLSTQDFYIQTGESISSGDTDNYFNPTIVSGATYSSNGVNLAVKAAVRTYNIIIGDQL